MWIRKTELELKELTRKNRFFIFIGKLEHNPLLLALIMFVIFFLINMLIELFIGVSHGKFSRMPMDPPIKFCELPQRIPYYLKFSAFLAINIIIIGYLWKKRTGEKKKEFVCEKCNKLIENNEINKFCDCGGEFVHIDKMKWVNEE